jgi:hypothetical protein
MLFTMFIWISDPLPSAHNAAEQNTPDIHDVGPPPTVGAD